MLNIRTCHNLAVLGVGVAGLLFCTTPSAFAQDEVPKGFHWVDFKREASTVLRIERALKGEDYTVIREIGVTDAFALVMTVQREFQTNFQGDAWRVYSLSMKTWKPRTLIYGYGLEVRDWMRFQSHGAQDLGVTYEDCWECEPASLFTALHYDSREGWRTRWTNDKDPSHPGIVFRITDAGPPYTDDNVDQVFAVLAPPDGVATVGTWYYARDLSTGKISNFVWKFLADPLTGKDKSYELTGSEAKAWELKLCAAEHSPFGLSQGQSSRACKRISTARAKDPK